MNRLVILASQSIQRRELLATLGFEFEVMPADIDELAIDDPDHALRAAKVALGKATKIRQQRPDAIIIAADTFILLNGQRLEKPLDINEAREMLWKMSGQTVSVHTGWVYWDPQLDVLVNDTSVDEVVFKKLSPAEIEQYVTEYPVTRWAGAWTMSHEPGRQMVVAVNGSLNSVLGIPIEKIVPHLRNSQVIR